MQKSKDLWLDRLPEEVSFWRHWMHDDEFREDRERRLTPDREVRPYVATILDRLGPNAQDEYRVLDVGSGPVTAVGSRHQGRRVRVWPVDPLGDYYADLLQEAGLTPPVPTTWCHGELLQERFAPASFEMAYAENSLDHAYDPLAIIRQMIALTKPHGTVLLEHRRNEGENHQYGGLHQWNFDLEGDRAVLWQGRWRVYLDRELDPSLTIQTWYIPEVNWLNVQLHLPDHPVNGDPPARRRWGRR